MKRIDDKLKALAETSTSLFHVRIPRTASTYVDNIALAPIARDLRSPSRWYNRISMPFASDKRFAVYAAGHPVCTQQPLDIPIYNRAWTNTCMHFNEFNQSLVFSVVRNPFDLLVSMFTYGFPYRRPREDKPKDALDTIGFPFASFDEFVRAFCDPNFSWVVGYQQRFLFFQIFNDYGDCVPHFLLRYECLDAALSRLFMFYKHTPKVSKKRLLASRNEKERDYRLYYSTELQQLVELKCSRELNAFGYTFDGHDGRELIDPNCIHYNPHTDEFRLDSTS